MVAAEGDRGKHIFFIARENDPDRYLAIVGAVGRVEGAATGVETDVSAKMAAEGGFERGGVELGGRGFGLEHAVQSIIRGHEPKRKDNAGGE
jgi:hypothetical protein